MNHIVHFCAHTHLCHNLSKHHPAVGVRLTLQSISHRSPPIHIFTTLPLFPSSYPHGITLPQLQSQSTPTTIQTEFAHHKSITLQYTFTNKQSHTLRNHIATIYFDQQWSIHHDEDVGCLQTQHWGLIQLYRPIINHAPVIMQTKPTITAIYLPNRQLQHHQSQFAAHKFIKVKQTSTIQQFQAHQIDYH